MKIKKIYLSGDHAGFKLKENVKKWLLEKYEVEDIGPLVYDKKDDYPDFVIPMARKVAKNKNSRGLIIAGSGQGEAITTNKIKGIKAGLYHGGSPKIVKTGRLHDDINILCMGSRFVSEKEAKRAIDIFLKSKFEGGRHSRRLKKMEKIER
ncbi:MAG TPA: RpiB/LacA/LacB family sugar-phosphate isomerase [Candidatus Pacearchaeota archaeon]|jgi:ribose 5-phosphate isomerase B|nr:RpiB/LacA/LacB family sugar-phosphate isomerase [Candidatus Pacearchaeota archaeon]